MRLLWEWKHCINHRHLNRIYWMITENSSLSYFKDSKDREELGVLRERPTSLLICFLQLQSWCWRWLWWWCWWWWGISGWTSPFFGDPLGWSSSVLNLFWDHGVGGVKVHSGDILDDGGVDVGKRAGAFHFGEKRCSMIFCLYLSSRIHGGF